MVRRGRLASIILLGMLTIWIFYLPVDLASGYGAPTLAVFGVGLLILSGLLAMNRRGWINVVALCLLLPIDAGFLAIQLSSSTGAGPAERAGSFPILIFTELVAAALLSPAVVFLTAFINCLVLLLAILTWPDPVRAALFTGSSPSTLYNIVVGAPATQFIIALVLFLFTSSALNALRRADRAEQVADMQRQLEERQRRELQEGAEHIRQVLANVSNGNYHARVVRVAHPLLWQIGTTLNTFVGRLDRLEFESYTLQRESQQAQRVADSIQLLRRGSPPVRLARLRPCRMSRLLQWGAGRWIQTRRSGSGHGNRASQDSRAQTCDQEVMTGRCGRIRQAALPALVDTTLVGE